MIKVFCGIKLKTMSALGNWRQAQNESLAISLWAKTVQLISRPPAQQWNTGGEEENTKHRKKTRKILDTIQWTVPTYIINHKKIKIMCGTPKEMSTENQDKLWQTPPLISLLGEKNSWKGVLVLLSISESLIIFSCPCVPATVPTVICCPLCCTFSMEKIYFRNDTTTKKKF